MIKYSLLAAAAVSSLLIFSSCAKEVSNKDTISQTNKPPDPPAGTASEPAARLKKNRPVEPPSANSESGTPISAGENSEFSIVMNSEGEVSERRVFKDHPQIIRADVTWTAPTNKILTLELKGGKIRKSGVPAEFDLKSVTSEGLLSVGKSASLNQKADRPRVVVSK